MQKNKKNVCLPTILAFLCSGSLLTTAYAEAPLWTFEPLTATTITVPTNNTALIQYRVTNQSRKIHILSMQAIEGLTQTTTGLGVCSNPFVLRSQDSCILSLQVHGSQLHTMIANAPVVCEQGSTLQCYHPDANAILRITVSPPISEAIITATGSPLTLTDSGAAGQLTINNTSIDVIATNIASNFTGTALTGNVTETGNTCANVPPGGSCTLTYTPGNTPVPQTNFTIQGTNTNALTAALAIQAVTLTAINTNSGTTAGEVGVTLTGSGLTGATGVTFDGIPATSVNVVNSTTVTAVTPAHVAGIVDVAINTPAGTVTLTNAYTYVSIAIGQPSGGGIIACLNGGLNNLIAATADNSTGIIWGGFGTSIGASAQSSVDGAANTTAIVATLGNNGGLPYAAQLCNDLEVDSQGNTPCQTGNTCYNDWFIPAGFNTTLSGQLYCLYANRVAIGGFGTGVYWSSRENTAVPTDRANIQRFSDGGEAVSNKLATNHVRCVRAFTP